jgi:hypothetical protein
MNTFGSITIMVLIPLGGAAPLPAAASPPRNDEVYQIGFVKL